MAFKNYFTMVQAVGYLALGWTVWPRIKVSPSHISFSGIPQERFYLSAKNDTDSDAYLVTVPIRVAKGLDGKISADFTLPRKETAVAAMQYAYCIGKDDFDYLIINFPHLKPGEAQPFTVSYSGGSSFTAVPKKVVSIPEPIATNDGMGRFGTGGIDYVDRCHFIFGPPKEGNTQ